MKILTQLVLALIAITFFGCGTPDEFDGPAAKLIFRNSGQKLQDLNKKVLLILISVRDKKIYINKDDLQKDPSIKDYWRYLSKINDEHGSNTGVSGKLDQKTGKIKVDAYVMYQTMTSSDEDKFNSDDGFKIILRADAAVAEIPKDEEGKPIYLQARVLSLKDRSGNYGCLLQSDEQRILFHKDPRIYTYDKWKACPKK